jgi:hypothetical protein
LISTERKRRANRRRGEVKTNGISAPASAVCVEPLPGIPRCLAQGGQGEPVTVQEERRIVRATRWQRHRVDQHHPGLPPCQEILGRDVPIDQGDGRRLLPHARDRRRRLALLRQRGEGREAAATLRAAPSGVGGWNGSRPAGPDRRTDRSAPRGGVETPTGKAERTLVGPIRKLPRPGFVQRPAVPPGYAFHRRQRPPPKWPSRVPQNHPKWRIRASPQLSSFYDPHPALWPPSPTRGKGGQRGSNGRSAPLRKPHGAACARRGAVAGHVVDQRHVEMLHRPCRGDPIPDLGGP